MQLACFQFSPVEWMEFLSVLDRAYCSEPEQKPLLEWPLLHFEGHHSKAPSRSVLTWDVGLLESIGMSIFLREG